MNKLLTPIWAFVRGNFKRFAWEVVAVLIGIGVTWLISHFTRHSELETCQDERTILLQQKADSQAVLDSVRWAGVISAKESQILRLEQENEALKEQAAATAKPSFPAGAAGGNFDPTTNDNAK